MTTTATTLPIPDANNAGLDRALVSAFLAHVPDFVDFKDREGRFIAVRESKIRHNGVKPPHEIIGMTDFYFLSAQDAQHSKDIEDEVMRTGIPLLAEETHVGWPD